MSAFNAWVEGCLAENGEKLFKHFCEVEVDFCELQVQVVLLREVGHEAKLLARHVVGQVCPEL